MPKIYLAGPMTGHTYDEANDWRTYTTGYLKVSDIETLSPMRGESYLEPGGMPDIQHAPGIPARDRNDIATCDAVLMNLLEMGSRVSIGTMIELGWADMLRKPVILVRRADCLSQHVMVNAMLSWDVRTLNEGIALAADVVNR